jgi:hypothetical protein
MRRLASLGSSPSARERESPDWLSMRQRLADLTARAVDTESKATAHTSSQLALAQAKHIEPRRRSNG